jgi:hypothetical protein
MDYNQVHQLICFQWKKMNALLEHQGELKFLDALSFLWFMIE